MRIDEQTTALATDQITIDKSKSKGSKQGLANCDIGAVVITFHPKTEHLGFLAKIRAQVDLLIVVDNGSTETELVEIRRVSQGLQARLIENEKNLGIATALNFGVKEAQEQDCRWVALFDQDSEVTEGFIEAMIDEFLRYRQSTRIMQIVPRYLDPETGAERPVSRFEDGGAFLTITSGSLFAIEVFEECGLFQENLFIYCVDDDFSLRIRKNGFFIGLSKKAVLLHRSGHPTVRKVCGKTLATKNYRPEVRYYYARNKVWILRIYARSFPRIILPTLREFVSIPLKILLMEDAPWRKIRLFWHGLVDGVAGRMGPMRKI